MTEKHSPLLPEDADERRMWDDSNETLGLTSLQRVGMMLHEASQMAPQGGSYREVMAIAYNEVTKADAILRAVNGLPEAIAALEGLVRAQDYLDAHKASGSFHQLDHAHDVMEQARKKAKAALAKAKVAPAPASDNTWQGC